MKQSLNFREEIDNVPFADNLALLNSVHAKVDRPPPEFSSGLLDDREKDYFDHFLETVHYGLLPPSNNSKDLPFSDINVLSGSAEKKKKLEMIEDNEEDYPSKRSKNITSKPLLDADQKRAHHIASEHKRRNRIRDELIRLTELVPGLSSTHRNSQAKILYEGNIPSLVCFICLCSREFYRKTFARKPNAQPTAPTERMTAIY